MAAGSAFAEEYAAFCRAYRAGTLTREDWADWYARRLREVLAHVTASSPFYARHLAGVDVAAVTPADLPTLPFTTKADLAREGYGMLSVPPARAAVFYETTGTTGPPTPCPRDAADVMTSNLHVEESWRRLVPHHFGGDTPVAALMGPSELYAFGDTFGAVADRLGISQVKLWPDSPRVGFDTALRLMRDLPVGMIICAPALCLSLAKAARDRGLDPRRDFSVRMFGVLGEVATPAFAANVTSIWGAELHHVLYGSQEALAIATGCPGRSLHLSQPNYLVELLDPADATPIGRYGTGELCVTMLISGAKPLIRYRTGDLVTVRPGGCDCGMPGDMITVIGRVADRIRLGGRLRHPVEVEAAVLDGERGCLGYQVAVGSGADGADELTVLLDVVPEIAGDLGAVRRRVSGRIRERLGTTAVCEVRSALDPVTGDGALLGWKSARIRDDRTSPALTS